jgi:hypothetical protein
MTEIDTMIISSTTPVMREKRMMRNCGQIPKRYNADFGGKKAMTPCAAEGIMQLCVTTVVPKLSKLS